VGLEGGPNTFEYIFSSPLDGSDSIGLAASLRLRIRSWWTPEEKKFAREKRNCLRAAARSGGLSKPLIPTPRPTSLATRTAYGKPVPAGFQVDHTIELQLGGCGMCKGNLRAIPSRVNASFGSQIMHQLKPVTPGTPITRVTRRGDQ